MISSLIYSIEGLILLSSLLAIRMDSGERQFSLSLLRSLFAIPMVIVAYLYFFYHFDSDVANVVLFTESVFSLIWLFMALRLKQATSSETADSTILAFAEIVSGAVLIAAVFYFNSRSKQFVSNDAFLVFRHYDLGYFLYIFGMVAVLYMAWSLEAFWRAQPKSKRWEYKFFVAGSYVICGSYVWAMSYRVTYLRLTREHFLLLAALLGLGWLFMSYAVARHRLLNRKIFVSRKVVYSFVAPFFFACYLFAVGIVSLLMRAFGWPLPYVLKWFFVSLGLVALLLFAFSGRIRRKVQFFISTHFYVNKYEYRDEWLAFSRLLQGAFSEGEIVRAFANVLSKSLYTARIIIWIGDETRGYRVVHISEGPAIDSRDMYLESDDPLVEYLREHDHWYSQEKYQLESGKKILETKEDFLEKSGLVLFTPLLVGEQLLGLVGLGEEYTGGRYGQDDFDLLLALGTQAASALLAVRMAEELAKVREQRAWDTMSAFVLHDVKNAAVMLSLVKENAPDHFDNPEFRKDMLDAVDDALKRMFKVQTRLKTLRGELSPNFLEIDLCNFVRDYCKDFRKKFHEIKIEVTYNEDLMIKSDPILLSRIFENLFLNSYDAGCSVISVHLRRNNKETVILNVSDDGSGIPDQLLPDKLFEPFKTSKPKGSGIGLWYVKKAVESLGGTIVAHNNDKGGASFRLVLPALR